MGTWGWALLLAVGVAVTAAAAWGLFGAPSLVAPGESNVVAARAWIAAAGPAVALIAAIVASAIGFQNLSVSRSALFASDRPWVGLDGLAMASPPAVGTSIATTVTLRNTGRSPAHRVRLVAVGYIGPQGEPPAIPDFPDQVVPQIVLPNATSSAAIWDNVALLTQADVDALTSGARVLLVSGQIEYFDSFGGRHVTKFQARYDLRSKAYVAAGPENSAD